MKNNIKNIWIGSFQFIARKPLVLLPFIVLAFLEALALELIYFSAQKPLSYIVSPIIQKFYGMPFTHYPGSMMILPRIFYYAQVFIYITVGALLTAIAVNIFINSKSNLPVKSKALIRNAFRKYGSYFAYALVAVALSTLLKKADLFVLGKGFRFLSRYAPGLIYRLAPFVTYIVLFLTNIVMQVFIIMAIPIIVIKNKGFFRALTLSLYTGLRNFLSIFKLIFLPVLCYFPFWLLKAFSEKIAGLTFPEANIYITIAGTLASIFVDCFLILCASQFLLNADARKAA